MPTNPQAWDLYQACRSRGSSPTLIWYGADGRIELSGKVVAQHLAKISAFLTEELWLDAGQRLSIDMPVHWKSILWGLGGLLGGADVATTEATNPAVSAVVVQSDPQPGPLAGMRTDSATQWCAISLSPFAFRWDGEPLPPDIHDGVAQIMGYPDVLFTPPESSSESFSSWYAAGRKYAMAWESGVDAESNQNGPRVESERVATQATGLEESLALAAYQLLHGCLILVESGNIDQIASVEGAYIAHLKQK